MLRATTRVPEGSSATRGRRPNLGDGGRAASFFLVPFFLVFTAVMVAPLVYAVVLSLFAQRRSGLGFDQPQQVFVGFENFVNVLQTQSFTDGFLRLGIYCLIYIPVMLGAALVLALLLDSAVAGLRRLFQLFLFLPHAVPGVIAALIWSYLYTPGVSPIVSVLGGVGIEINFLSVQLVLPSMVNIGVWEWTGYNVVILFTALQAVPRDTLEAAVIDGSSGIRTAVSIKLPQILPALSVTVLFTIIGTLQLFTEPSIISKSAPSVSSTWVPNMWAYDAAFNRHDLNQAAAASLILAVIAGILSAVVTRFSAKVSA